MPRISSIRRGLLRETWLAYVVFAAALLITVLLTSAFLKGEQERQALEAQKQAIDVQNRFATRMGRNMTALVGGAALFGVDARLTPAEFRNFARSLQRFGALDGVLALGFCPRVTAQELPGYWATVKQRVPGFHVWPEDARDEYFPVELIEPLTEQNRKVIGYNMHAEAVRKAAVEFARKHGEPAASGRLSLLQDQGKQGRFGFVIYVPIYQRGVEPGSADERGAGLVGFIFAAYRADDLVAWILSAAERATFAVQLFTGPRDAAEALYQSPLPEGSELISSRSLGVGGRDLTLSLYLKPHAVSAWDSELIVSAALGVIVSLLLFLVLRTQVQARLKAVTNAAHLREARATAVRNLRARETFLSVASHELKTPLTALQLQVDSLAMSLANAAPVDLDRLRARADNIGRQTKRLGSLVEDLLDVSQVSASPLSLQLENTSLVPLIQDVMDSFATAAKQAHSEVRFEADDDALSGMWDRRRLQKVISTLVSNAIKYGCGRPIVLTAKREDANAVITVSDHGIGIAQADQERIFGRFERAVSPKHFGGMGLGLWIARAIVESMGGTIRVASSPGAGATFVVSLPAASAGLQASGDAMGAA